MNLAPRSAVIAIFTANEIELADIAISRLGGGADVLLPVQRSRGTAEPCGPCRLHREILLSAVGDLLKAVTSVDKRAGHEHVRLAQAAARWIDGAEPGAPVAFEVCCEAFNTSPDLMRGKIARLVQTYQRDRGRRHLRLGRRPLRV
jgi:hypothetical protein